MYIKGQAHLLSNLVQNMYILWKSHPFALITSCIDIFSVSCVAVFYFCFPVLCIFLHVFVSVLYTSDNVHFTSLSCRTPAYIFIWRNHYYLQLLLISMDCACRFVQLLHCPQCLRIFLLRPVLQPSLWSCACMKYSDRDLTSSYFFPFFWSIPSLLSYCWVCIVAVFPFLASLCPFLMLNCQPAEFLEQIPHFSLGIIN